MQVYYLQNSCDESLLLQGTNNSYQIERVCFHLERNIEESEHWTRLSRWWYTKKVKHYFAVLVSKSLKLYDALFGHSAIIVKYWLPELKTIEMIGYLIFSVTSYLQQWWGHQEGQACTWCPDPRCPGTYTEPQKPATCRGTQCQNRSPHSASCLTSGPLWLINFDLL